MSNITLSAKGETRYVMLLWTMHTMGLLEKEHWRTLQARLVMEHGAVWQYKAGK